MAIQGNGLKSTTNDSNQNKFVSFYEELTKKKNYNFKSRNITNSNVLVILCIEFYNEVIPVDKN